MPTFVSRDVRSRRDALVAFLTDLGGQAQGFPAVATRVDRDYQSSFVHKRGRMAPGLVAACEEAATKPLPGLSLFCTLRDVQI
jgi:hypothetical protein